MRRLPDECLRMILAVFMSPVLTLPPALALLGVLAWYWNRLGRRGVPGSRRRIRRLSLLIAGVTLCLLVAGMSFVDPDVRQIAFVVIWSMTVLLTGLLLLMMMLDLMNNRRLHAQLHAELLRESIEAHQRKLRNDATSGSRPPDSTDADERPDHGTATSQP